MPDDAECLRQYAESRDEGAFAEFVGRNLDLVYSSALRQAGGNSSLAEDVTQRVFTSAAQKAAGLARHPVVTAWLYKTTRFVTVDAVRSDRRRWERESTAAQMTEINQLAATDWEIVSPELDQIIASLDEGDRDAVVLRFFGRDSFVTIGAHLHLTENAARMRVSRALERLRRRLAKKGITSSTAALTALLEANALVAAPATLGAASIGAALKAPAVGGLISLWSTLQIMTTAKVTTSITAAIALLGVATAYHEHKRAEAAEQEARASSSRAAAAEQRIANGTAAKSAPNHPQAHAAIPGAGRPRAPQSPLYALLRILSDPAMQKQQTIQAKMRLDVQYPDLFKSLKLSPDQLEQFKNLLVEKQMVAFDSISAAHDQGIDYSTDPRGLYQAIASAQKTVDGQISALLGADNYGQFEDYQKTIPARNTSTLVSQALSYTSDLLTDAESKSLIQILTTTGKPAVPTNNPYAVLNSDMGVIGISDPGLAQIQGILSPSQYQVLQEKMQQQFQLLQIRKHMGP